MKKYLRWSYALLFIFITITFFVLYHPVLKEGTFSENSENVPEIIVTNVSLIRFNEAGQPKETLKTPRLYRMSNESFFYLEKPTISIQQENRDIWYIQAEQAQVPEQKGLITFEKNVLVYSESGAKKAPSYLKTEKLFYDSKTQFAMSPLSVSFEQPESIISGTGMKAWMLEKKIELLGTSKNPAHYREKTGEDTALLHAYANNIQYDHKKHVMTLLQNAKLIRGKESLKAPVIQYDTEKKELLTKNISGQRTEIILEKGRLQ